MIVYGTLLVHIRSVESEPKISKKKKKCTVGRFLHTGPKKGVEKEYEVYFAKIRDKKVRHTFL